MSTKTFPTTSRFWFLGLAILLGLGLALTMPVMASAQRTDPAAPNAATATTYHVAKSGAGSDGLSWTTAFTNLQDALALAVDGDEIWVATGVYTPGLSRSDSFTLISGVQVYGGFAATETLRTERDWETNVTVLSGDIDGDDTTDANGVVTTTANISGSNSYHVVWADGVTDPITETTVLDGFTITAGQATGSFPHDSGGGMYCNGADNHRCSPSLSHLHFSANITTGSGGGLFNDGYFGYSSPTLTHVSFAGNEAEWGGGMSNYGYRGNSNPTLVNVTFSGNRATFGGAMDNLADLWGHSSPSLVNVTFANNVATANGGAIRNDAGGTGTGSGLSNPSLNNVILWGNTAITGSQIYNIGATPVLSYTLIQSDSNAIVNDNGGSVNYGPHLLTSDPLFANPLGTDGISGTLDDDLRLLPGSPAIDSGDNSVVSETTDLDGNPRFYDDPDVVDTGNGAAPIVDLGAYERQSNSLCAIPLYVDQTATGTNTGLTWTDAFTDLRTALSSPFALSCPTPEIWVATGVYTPGLSQSDSFTLTSGMQLYGGFAATETLRTERDWEAHPTILSGDIDGDDLTDANGVVTDTANISGSNSDHVVWVDGVTSPITGSVVLDGFTITAGQADGAFPDNSGAGFFCDGAGVGSECSPSLNNLSFYGNAANENGGGLFNSGLYTGTSSPILNNILFSGNWAGNDGGGMYTFSETGESSPILADVTFAGNLAADDGGGMFNRADSGGVSQPILNHVTFSNNGAQDSGGALYNYGANGGDSSPFLNNVTFSENWALDSGGAMRNYSNGGTSNASLVNVAFTGNQAANEGGAMANLAANNGTSSPSLVNVLFSGNAANNGGALFSWGESGTSSPVLINVTFSGNAAVGVGGAMINDGNAGICLPLLSNVILWENTGGGGGDQLFNVDAQLVITNSLIQGGLNGAGVVNLGSASMTDGGGNIAVDPHFIQTVDPASAPTTAGDLRLQSGSPAIDAGDNDALPGDVDADLDGDLRIQDGDADGIDIVDMGAYEAVTHYLLTASKVGYGAGLVSSDPFGIDCGITCTLALAQNSTVTLTATADTGSIFTGWSGACTNTSGDCIVTMDAAKSVTATFTLEQYELSVVLEGTGSGNVTSDPAGITCGNDCSKSLDYGTVVTLTATADPGSTFTGWSGACTGTGSCVVTLDEAQNVTATFTLEQTDYFIFLPVVMKP